MIEKDKNSKKEQILTKKFLYMNIIKIITLSNSNKHQYLPKEILINKLYKKPFHQDKKAL